MNLVVLVTKKKVWCCHIHSNFHHLKVVKNIVDHFRYSFLGGEVGRKNNITPKEMKDKIKKNNNPYDYTKWWEYEGLRKLQFIDSYNGYIILDLRGEEDYGCNNIYMNLATTERDEEEFIYPQFKQELKEVLKHRK